MTKFLPLTLACLVIASVTGAEAPNPANLPPLPSMPPSPIEKFRSWLAMSAEEREKALAAYPSEKQKVLREKLREYEILPGEQRNRRLSMLELRWYLRPLMNLPGEQRGTQLMAVPPPLQPMVMERLRAWDQLDAPTREELLASEERRELVMAYFAQIRRGIPESRIFGELPENQRAQLQAALDAWNKTPSTELQRKAEHIAAFFETQPDAQAKAMAALSPAEKAEIQRTLDAFAQLPIAQRRACVNSFQKFATMNPEERNHFLRNAARWREMTSHERETWKNLVSTLPPMPPEPEEKHAAPMPGQPAPAGLNRIASTNGK